jgi:hypothetical protein
MGDEGICHRSRLGDTELTVPVFLPALRLKVSSGL